MLEKLEGIKTSYLIVNIEVNHKGSSNLNINVVILICLKNGIFVWNKSKEGLLKF